MGLSGAMRVKDAEIADLKDKVISFTHENDTLKKELQYFYSRIKKIENVKKK